MSGEALSEQDETQQQVQVAPDSKEVQARLLNASSADESQNKIITLEKAIIQDQAADQKKVLEDDAHMLGTSIPAQQEQSSVEIEESKKPLEASKA